MELGGLPPTNVGVPPRRSATRLAGMLRAQNFGIRKHFPTECVHVVHRIRHSGGGSKGCWPPTSPIESRIHRPEGEEITQNESRLVRLARRAFTFRAPTTACGISLRGVLFCTSSQCRVGRNGARSTQYASDFPRDTSRRLLLSRS